MAAKIDVKWNAISSQLNSEFNVVLSYNVTMLSKVMLGRKVMLSDWALFRVPLS